jgi:hypothetical protein
MSSSTTSSLVANRKGVLFKLRGSFLLSLTMTARSALVLHRATRHSGKYVGRRSTRWRCRSQPFKVLRFVTSSGTVPAFVRSLEAPILSRVESRSPGGQERQRLISLGDAAGRPWLLWPHSGEARTQGRVLPYRAAAPAQMKERDAVVRMAATRLLGSL